MYKKNLQVEPPLAVDIEGLFNCPSNKIQISYFTSYNTLTSIDYSLEVVIKHDLHHKLSAGYKYVKTYT